MADWGLQVDSGHVVDSISTALGEGSDTANALLVSLFHAYAEAGHCDWDGVQRILSAQSLTDEKAAALLEALRALASEAGSAEDPGAVFEDSEVCGRFLADTQASAAGGPAGTPVAEGSLISMVDGDFYLNGNHQVWPVLVGETRSFHDGTQYFDELGRLDSAPPVSGEDRSWANFDVADRLVRGHSKKHIENEFPGMTDDQVRDHLRTILDEPSAECEYTFGDILKTAFWHEESGTLIILDHTNEDGGTFFRPPNGKAKFREVCEGQSDA